MTDPTLADISQAQLQIVALARHVSGAGIDRGAARILLDDMDTRLACIVAARLINALCRDLANHLDCTASDLLDGITRTAIEAAGDQRHQDDDQAGA
jgi:hypothetical protein